MSGLVLAGRNKKRFIMCTSIALAFLIWLMPSSIQELDLTTVSLTQIASGSTAVIALATILYHSRFDERIDRRLKAQADKGAWRGVGKGRGFLIESIAKMNIHTNPWFSPNWDSIEKDRDKALDDVLEEPLIQDRLWSVKVGLATGITITIGILRISLIIGVLAAGLAFLAGIVITYSTLTRAEFTELPMLVQKLAIQRYFADQSDASVSRLSENLEIDANLTLKSKMQDISESCSDITDLIEEKRWSIFETKLMLLVQRLDGGLYTKELYDILEWELSNTWISTLLSFSSEETIRKSGERFQEYISRIRNSIELAYSSSGYPPEWLFPWLDYDASRARLDSAIEMVDFNKLNQRTVDKLSSYFAWGEPQVLGSTLERGASSWLNTELPERFRRLVYSFYNSDRVSETTKNSEHVRTFIGLRCSEFIKPEDVKPYVIEAIVGLLQTPLEEEKSNELTQILYRIAQDGGSNYSARYSVLRNIDEFTKIGFHDLTKSDFDKLIVEVSEEISNSSSPLQLLESLPFNLVNEPKIGKTVSDIQLDSLEKEILESYSIDIALKGAMQSDFIEESRIQNAIITRLRNSRLPSYDLEAISGYPKIMIISEVAAEIQRLIPRLIDEILSSREPELVLYNIRNIESVYTDQRIRDVEEIVPLIRRRNRGLSSQLLSSRRIARLFPLISTVLLWIMILYDMFIQEIPQVYLIVLGFSLIGSMLISFLLYRRQRPDVLRYSHTIGDI